MDVTVDLVALTICNGELHILLIQRAKPPFVGQWALPGGRVEDDEDLADGARRELGEETGVGPGAQLARVGTYAAVGRDPRGRVLSVAWLALLPEPGSPAAGSDAAAACWWPVRATPRLAFDLDEILRDGVECLRARIEHTPDATALCAREFTLTQLRGVYEAVWGIRLDPRNFHRNVLHTPGFLHPTRTRRRRLRPIGAPTRFYMRGDADILHPPLRRPRATAPTAIPPNEEPQP